jgi:ankyrin repeat protein
VASASTVETFFNACASGDVAAMREWLATRPGLVHERHDGTTALHVAVQHPDAVRLLLERGADPHARDVGDNALPLHFAAGGGWIASVRLLLDAGSDVHGVGDLHQMDVIGWATLFRETHHDVVDLLVERGAQHHIFTAIALGDLDLLRRVVSNDPTAMTRRLSKYEQEQTALHYVIAPADGLVGGLFRTGGHYRTLDVLIELGADLEAQDAKGRTPLAVAMLRGDVEAMRRLHAAGARQPAPAEPVSGTVAALSPSIKRLTPMLSVQDMRATIEWYQTIGFELAGSYGDNGALNWASVRFGDVEIMFVPSSEAWRQHTSGVSVWIRTDRIDDIYAHLKEKQLARARAVLNGEPVTTLDVRFAVDLYTAFYGQREFGVIDPDGVHVMFAQSA